MVAAGTHVNSNDTKIEWWTCNGGANQQWAAP